MKTYIIQIQVKTTVSREIKANSFDDAVVIAKDYAESYEEKIKPARGWTREGDDTSEVAGVFV